MARHTIISSLLLVVLIPRLMTANAQCTNTSRPLILYAYLDTPTLLVSPYYPNNYYDNMDCQWLITAQQSQWVVKLLFYYFKTESLFDVVQIYDGDSINAPLLSEMSGEYAQPPTNITSSQQHMLVRFTTNDNVTYDGFRASFEANTTTATETTTTETTTTETTTTETTTTSTSSSTKTSSKTPLYVTALFALFLFFV